MFSHRQSAWPPWPDYRLSPDHPQHTADDTFGKGSKVNETAKHNQN